MSKRTVAALAILLCLSLSAVTAHAQRVAQIYIGEIGFRGEIRREPGGYSINGEIKKSIFGTMVRVSIARIQLARDANGHYSYIEKRKLGPFGGKIVMYFQPQGSNRMKCLARLEVITGIRRVHIPGPSHNNTAQVTVSLSSNHGPPTPPPSNALSLTVRNNAGQMLDIEVRYLNPSSSQWSTGNIRLHPGQSRTINRFTRNPTIGIRATGYQYISDGGPNGQVAANGRKYIVARYRPGTNHMTQTFNQ